MLPNENKINPETADTYTEKKVTKSDSTLRHAFFTKFWNAYTYSPINLSTITGWRYPGIPRLMGNPIVGRVPHIMSKNGFMDNLMQAGKLAGLHPSGMCYYWLANRPVLLITKPEHIQEVLVKNSKNISMNSATMTFKLFLGSNILTESPDLWRKKREIYSNIVYKKVALRQTEPHMLAVIKKTLQELTLCGSHHLG